MGDALQSLPQARGVWGHARLGNFGFLHSQRSILVHFSRYFLKFMSIRNKIDKKQGRQKIELNV